MTNDLDGVGGADIRAVAFEALPMQAAVLGADGVIRAVNRAWRLFGELNGDDTDPGAWVGTSYLGECHTAMGRGGDGAADAKEAAEGIAAVCEGRQMEFEMEYPCPSPSEQRWFLLRASPLPSPYPGAIVTHLDITRRKRLEQSLEHSATHDPLTGLPNRALLHDRLEVALGRRAEARNSVVVFFCDIDGFKEVNDTLGHASGDEVISMAASRLEGALRAGDSLARIGGDEFVVVCEDARSMDPAETAARVEEAFSASFQVGARAVTIGITLGWALGGHGDDSRELLEAADRHMYERKSEKRRIHQRVR